MAGPRGGAPRKRARKSHTKSRKGCETCKRRHIRCDENYPQCRNCTKHQCRCAYHEGVAQETHTSTPEKTDPPCAPEVQAEIENWLQSDSFPPLDFYAGPSLSPQYWSFEDLGIIYSMSSGPSAFGIYDSGNLAIGTELVEGAESIICRTQPWNNEFQFNRSL